TKYYFMRRLEMGLRHCKGRNAFESCDPKTVLSTALGRCHGIFTRRGRVRARRAAMRTTGGNLAVLKARASSRQGYSRIVDRTYGQDHSHHRCWLIPNTYA